MLIIGSLSHVFLILVYLQRYKYPQQDEEPLPPPPPELMDNKTPPSVSPQREPSPVQPNALSNQVPKAYPVTGSPIAKPATQSQVSGIGQLQGFR